METKKEIRVRFWVYLDDSKFFGIGRFELLKRIDQSGSIANAAKEMGMSYKKAWAMVDDINSRGKTQFITPKKGGQKGGGSELTEAGRALLLAYEKLNAELCIVAENNTEIMDLI